MPRPSAPKLDPDLIADAAIALVDEGGKLGIVPLARRLGVAPSSLYNHVDGREGIIELMRRRLGARPITDIAGEAGAAWDEVVERIMREQLAVYAAHPLVLPLLVGTTVTDPVTLETYDALAGTLLRAGFPESEVIPVIGALDAFALGAGLDYSSPEEAWHTEDEESVLGRLMASAPRGVERSHATFALGLELLIEALRARLAARHGAQ